MKVLEKARRDEYPCAVLGMSEHGLISRLLATKFGSYLTFGSICAGIQSRRTADVTRFERVVQGEQCTNERDESFGRNGKPIAQSKSPQLHNKA